MRNQVNASLSETRKLITQEILHWEDAHYRYCHNMERAVILAALMAIISLGICTNPELYTKKIILSAALAALGAIILGCIIYIKPPQPPLHDSSATKRRSSLKTTRSDAFRWIEMLTPLFESLEHPETQIQSKKNRRGNQVIVRLHGDEHHCIKIQGRAAEHLLDYIRESSPSKNHV